MPRMGLVLQGGGALGAYEYGAVTRLVELGWEPVAVAGVSIGAATAAAVAGARDGDVCASIKRLWHEITLKPLPYWPSDLQVTFSLFGTSRCRSGRARLSCAEAGQRRLSTPVRVRRLRVPLEPIYRLLA